MLAKFYYLAFGFVIGAGLLLALTMANDTRLAKTSRLNSSPVAPVDFVMERFG